MIGAAPSPLSWFGIVRLGLVQTALGAVVVLTTSTLNRVMVIELALPAMIPGLLVAIHYAMQVLRPWLGHGSDVGGRRFAWIVGGMAVLAAVATALMASQLVLGLVVAVIAFIMIGIGVGAAGTSLLVLLAKRTAPERRSGGAVKARRAPSRLMRTRPAPHSCTTCSPCGRPPSASQTWHEPSVGWPANGSSRCGVKMRTR